MGRVGCWGAEGDGQGDMRGIMVTGFLGGYSVDFIQASYKERIRSFFLSPLIVLLQHHFSHPLFLPHTTHDPPPSPPPHLPQCASTHSPAASTPPPPITPTPQKQKTPHENPRNPFSKPPKAAANIRSDPTHPPPPLRDQPHRRETSGDPDLDPEPPTVSTRFVSRFRVYYPKRNLLCKSIPASQRRWMWM